MCARLECSFISTYFGNVDNAECIGVIVSHLNSLKLRGIWSCVQEWSNGLAQCSNLRKLHAEASTEFLPLLPNLLHLEEFVLNSESVSYRDISCIAAKTSNLSTFCLKSSFIVDAKIFKPLVESNKYLENVSVNCFLQKRSKKRPPTDCSLKILRQLLVTFSNCRKLQLFLRCTKGQDITLQDVRNICSVLPCRGVHVRIEIGCSIFYEQTGKPIDLSQ